MFLCCAALGTVVIVSSCEENQGGDNPLPPIDMVGNSIFLPNAADTVITVTMELDDVWKVRNSNTWFSVYPLSGDPGTVELSVSVLEANTELREKEADFIITVGVGENETNTRYYVFQDPIPGWNLETSTASVSGEAQSYTFPIQGNLDFEAVLAEGVDWITIDGVTESDSTLLSDNTTYSAYRTYNINMQIEANDGEVRSTEIYLNGVDGTVKDTIEISQMGKLVADYSREFYRRSIAFRFTSTSCGYCPIMAAAMKAVHESSNGRFIPFTLYANSSSWMPSAGGLAYDGTDEFERIFNPSQGYPCGIVNGYANVGNYSQSIQEGLFASVMDEAVENLPSDCAIGGVVSSGNGNINVNLSIASKAGGAYTLGVYLLEDGIIYTQSGAGSNYEHNFVVRANFTDNIMGDDITLTAQQQQDVNFNMPIPTSIKDINNCYVCVWIAKDGTYSGSVGNVEYTDFGMLVDNAVTIPIGGFVVYEYEN